jgi:hypothetical protein
VRLDKILEWVNHQQNAGAWPKLQKWTTHFVVCLTTNPKPLPKRVLHKVWSSISAFSFLYPLVSLRSSSSCFRLLPSLHVTSIFPSIFLSIMCFRRQFLRKILPVQLVLLLWLTSIWEG